MSGYFSYGDIGYTPSSSSDIKLNHEVLLMMEQKEQLFMYILMELDTMCRQLLVQM
ncbi:MAG: hypothetical protein HC874_15860 [Richelia sp. SL_2_1]|nr:hypothetical protein [Richelia sp. SL_2_1]